MRERFIQKKMTKRDIESMNKTAAGLGKKELQDSNARVEKRGQMGDKQLKLVYQSDRDGVMEGAVHWGDALIFRGGLHEADEAFNALKGADFDPFEDLQQPAYDNVEDFLRVAREQAENKERDEDELFNKKILPKLRNMLEPEEFKILSKKLDKEK